MHVCKLGAAVEVQQQGLEGSQSREALQPIHMEELLAVAHVQRQLVKFCEPCEPLQPVHVNPR